LNPVSSIQGFFSIFWIPEILTVFPVLQNSIFGHGKNVFFKPKSYPFLAMEEKQHFCFFEPKNYPKTLNLEGNPLLLL